MYPQLFVLGHFKYVMSFYIANIVNFKWHTTHFGLDF